MADEFNLTLDPATDSYRWTPPEILPPALIAEAQRTQLELAGALQPAPAGVKLQWLVQLGVLTAGTMSVDEAKGRIRAYERDLAHPPLCFTDETRIAAARRFKFFPSFAELAKFLDEQVAGHKERLRRLKRLAAQQPTAPEKPIKRYADMSEAEKAEFDRMMAPFRGSAKRDTVPAGAVGDVAGEGALRRVKPAYVSTQESRARDAERERLAQQQEGDER